jgi:16S rRNA (guanine527-N7)-methyltransferase
MTADSASSLLQAGLDSLQISATRQQQQALLNYLDAILEENLSINVTAIRDRETAVVQHLLDSLTLIPWWRSVSQRDAPRSLLDLGTGGGFPAAPLAILWPSCKVLAIDSTLKKIGVVQRCAQRAGIKNLQARQARGSDLPGLVPCFRQHFELATARAVGPASKLLQELLPLTHLSGWIALLKGTELPPAEQTATEKLVQRYKLVQFPPVLSQVSGLNSRAIWAFRRASALKNQAESPAASSKTS